MSQKTQNSIPSASGGVGTFAIQIARLFTSDVTAVCSTDKVSNAQNLGATEVIDYSKDEFFQNGQKYDIIFDAVGRRKISYSQCKNSLTEKGIYKIKFLTESLFYLKKFLARDQDLEFQVF